MSKVGASDNAEAALRKRLAQLAGKQQALQAQFICLLGDPEASSAAIERAQREIIRLTAQQTQLVA